jgi:hypothetical protein
MNDPIPSRVQIRSPHVRHPARIPPSDKVRLAQLIHVVRFTALDRIWQHELISWRIREVQKQPEGLKGRSGGSGRGGAGGVGRCPWSWISNDRMKVYEVEWPVPMISKAQEGTYHLQEPCGAKPTASPGSSSNHHSASFVSASCWSSRAISTRFSRISGMRSGRYA